VGGGAAVPPGVPARKPYGARERGIRDEWDRYLVDVYRLTGLGPADAQALTMNQIEAWSAAERRRR
jgi:hypothetical protein